MPRLRVQSDGLPYRLYMRRGKRTTSFGYKRPDGKWEFRLSAPTNNRTKVARARQEAIKRANELNGAWIEPGTLIELIDDYFDWQESLSITDARRKTEDTLKENRRETTDLEHTAEVIVYHQQRNCAARKSRQQQRTPLLM